MRNQLYLCWNSYLIRDAPNCVSIQNWRLDKILP